MTVLLERLQAELLRWLYALSIRHWPDPATGLMLGALVGTFVVAALRIRAKGAR